jgi:hypothetical protein
MMGKAIALLLGVVVIWITVELYTQGPDAAFGGRLAHWSGASRAAEPRPTTVQRASAAVERAQHEQEERYRELMPE